MQDSSWHRRSFTAPECGMSKDCVRQAHILNEDYPVLRAATSFPGTRSSHGNKFPDTWDMPDAAAAIDSWLMLSDETSASPPPPPPPPEVPGNCLRMRSIPASLQKRISKTKICIHNLSGRCSRAANCSFAHSMEELREPPDLYKTRLCVNFMSTGGCQKMSNCRFAHGEEELRWTPEFYKTSLCPYWHAEGKAGCSAGGKCRWAHGFDELRQRLAAPCQFRETSSIAALPPLSSTDEPWSLEEEQLKLDIRLLELRQQWLHVQAKLQQIKQKPAVIPSISTSSSDSASSLSSSALVHSQSSSELDLNYMNCFYS